MDQDSLDVLRPGGIAAHSIAQQQHPPGSQRGRRSAQHRSGVFGSALQNDIGAYVHQRPPSLTGGKGRQRRIGNDLVRITRD
jgi:hypothetical protein